MKNFLKEKVKELYDEGYDFYDLHYDLFGEDNVENWPTTPMPPIEDFDGDAEEYEDLKNEPQDMENFEWVSVTEDEAVVCCGGDWQMPMKITMQFNGEKLVVVDTEEDFFEDGLSEKEFNDILELETPDWEDDEDVDEDE